MSQDFMQLVKKWRETGNTRLSKRPEDPTGHALCRCANELEAQIQNRHSLAGPTALLAGALVFTEPMLPRLHRLSDQLALPEHTHGESHRHHSAPTTLSVRAAASGSNVSVQTENFALTFADDLRAAAPLTSCSLSIPVLSSPAALTVPSGLSKLLPMAVNLKPETESRLQDLSAATGLSPEDLSPCPPSVSG